MEIKNKHGGAGRGQGRKKKYSEDVKRISVYVPQSIAGKFRNKAKDLLSEMMDNSMLAAKK